ncbi:MAG: low molecular weight phosphatase family protein [Roseburia sp.]|nr:low molecular weight phosphatase family protein [Roseburia sp.]
MTAGAGAKTAKKKLNIIFVCTGNTCRSPMAEFLFKQYLKDKKRASDFSVSSAGLYAERGGQLNENADKALELLNVPHTLRKSKPFTVQMSLDGDLIVCMTREHARLCESDGAISYDALTGREVPDPFGGTLAEYLDCAAQIRSGFDELLRRADALLALKKSG